MLDDLYTAKILKAAANMPRAGRLARPDASAEKVSKLCGSRVLVDVVLKDGRIADYAQEVKACALGQAAAAIMGEHAVGASVEEIESARDALRAMLKSGGPPPEGRFAELAMLAPVKDYPPRHASTLLAFEATAEACRLAMPPQPERSAERTSRAGAA
jgi:NifU-like protein involved in Fe-S cluster formation